MRNWKVVAIAVTLCAAATAVHAQQKGTKALTAQDYAEIQQLYIRYNYGIDSHAGNGTMWSHTFTPDGTFVNGKTETHGREKLTAFAKSTPNAGGAPHHFVTNIKIEPAAEGATGSAYFFNVTTPESGKLGTINVTGTYEDVLVKTAEGWRFKKRTFYANALPPSLLAETATP